MAWRTIVVGLACTFSALAGAGDQAIRRSEVPGAVLETVATLYPKARMTGFGKEVENGKTAYEVELETDGRHTDVLVSSEGKLLVEEQTIEMKDVPEAVQKGLAASRYASARVTKVEKVTGADAPDAPRFEIVVRQGAERHELVFEATGKLKKDEAPGK